MLRRLLARRREVAGTWTLEVEGDPAHPFGSGQFNMLYAIGAGEVPISLSGDPARPERLIHTIREVGLTTAALCRLHPGDQVGVRGPFGRGWPVATAAGSDVIVVAGGLGLAPLRPAIYELIGRRGGFGRVTVLYGARGPAEILYASELQRWRSRFDLDVEVTVDAAGEGWRGPVGVVTRLIRRAPMDPEQTLALVCGPEVMMRFAAAALLDRGLDAGSVWLSMERNMQCGIGLCGHCQLGRHLICRDGPVLSLAALATDLKVREL